MEPTKESSIPKNWVSATPKTEKGQGIKKTNNATQFSGHRVKVTADTDTKGLKPQPTQDSNQSRVVKGKERAKANSPAKLDKRTSSTFDERVSTNGHTKETPTDPDGFPSMESIQSMSKDSLEKTFSSIKKKTDREQFLAKVGVAAQKLDSNNRMQVTLIKTAVILYAKNAGIDTSNLSKEHKSIIVRELGMRALAYRVGKQDITSGLMKMAMGALEDLGLPSIKSIQSMSQPVLEKTFSDNENRLQFLAKACVAAQKLGLHTDKARRLLNTAVEHYAKALNVDPLGFQTETEFEDVQSKVVKGLTDRAQLYIDEGVEGPVAATKEELKNMAKGAFKGWVIEEQVMNDNGIP